MAAHMAMIAKHALAIRRPDQLDGRIQPMIPTPGHGSFPSAHATEAYAVMTVMEGLTGSWGSFADQTDRMKMLRGLAERIAVNRTVAGVHFPIDSWAGAALGTALGQVVLQLCGQTGAGAVTSLQYTPGNDDFSDYQFTQQAVAHGLQQGATFSVSATDHFSWIWEKALTETQKV